ncbi:MAG: FAD:protein FMN transferase [Deferribacteres bacterium]|nr:FAD:protein FMN transferase [Deferribacteres bacterium]
MKRAAACLLIMISLAFISGCTERDRMYRESRVLMDTFCTITVVSASEEKAREAINRGFAEIERLDGLLNYFSEDSEITAVNRAAGRPVRVSRETLDIVKKAVHISEITGGAFDPTIAPVVSLWKFSKDISAPSIPSRDAVATALRHVDYRKIEINTAASEIYLTEKGMELDLGGIAKGYAADRAVEAVKAEGIKAALVAVAGDIRGFGLNPSGQGWRLGIQDPRPETVSERPWEDVFATLELRDRAISTSGDYQRFFIKDGKRYFHILDPVTGFPAETDLISVTVIAPEGYVTDSLATAVFVLGVEKGMKLLESMGIDGVLVCADKKILLTEHLRGKINILNPAYQAVNYSP